MDDRSSYLDARVAFERVQQEAAQALQALEQVASALKADPVNFAFRGPMITQAQLAELLDRYREAHRAMNAAWKAVPTDQRTGLLQPPQKDLRSVRVQRG